MIVKEIHKEEGEIQYKCKMDGTIILRKYKKEVRKKGKRNNVKSWKEKEKSGSHWD